MQREHSRGAIGSARRAIANPGRRRVAALALAMGVLGGLATPAAARIVQAGSVAAPRGLTAATPTRSAPALRWGAVTGAARYRVYRDGTRVAAVTSTGYTDTALTASGVHSYAVRAVTAGGLVSARSNVLAVTFDRIAPAAPAALAGSAETGTPQLSWSPATDALSGIASYRVWRGGTLVASPAGTSFSDVAAGAAGSYTYTVRAVDRAGNVSPPSAPVTVTVGGGGGSVDTTPPDAPGPLTAGTGQTAMDLSWAPANDNVGVTGYDLYRNGSRVGTVTGTAYTFAGLACGSSYTLGVVAFDAAGNRSGMSTLGITTGTCTAPAATMYDVRTYGARGDGVANDSAAFAAAISAASSTGTGFAAGPGGRPQGIVYVPAGTYRLMNVPFKSNVRMEVDAAAVLEPTGGGGSADGSLFRWTGPAGSPLRNVTIIGVGTSMTGKPAPAAGWDISHSFTFNVDPAATGGSSHVRAMLVMNVDGFLIQNVFSIQNNSHTDMSYPTSTTAVMAFKAESFSPIGGPYYDPHNGAVVNQYNIHSPQGYGPNQVNSAHGVDFRQIYSEGGTALRMETDAAQGRYGSMVDGVTGETIECRNGNRAVSLSPHDQLNRNVTVSGVLAVDCYQGVTATSYVQSGLKMGGFLNASISGILVQGGSGAQLPSGGGWSAGLSAQAINVSTSNYTVAWSGLTCSGSFQHASDVPC